MKLALGAAALAAIALAASACGSGHAKTGRQTSGQVSSTRLILGGAVRCTATLATPVEVGHELGLSVTFHNVSKRTVDVQPAYGGQWVVVNSPDGTTYDTRVPLEDATGPPPAPIPLRPGATATRHMLRSLRVRWNGPLRVTPGCDVSAAPTVRVAVTSPGLPASRTAAVNDVVAATGHLLDHCRPAEPGVSVVGRIDPPSGDAPPLQARCILGLTRERGFYEAQLLVVTPPDLQGVRILPPYYTLLGPTDPNRNTQSIAWVFVVTRDGATSVSSADFETSQPGSAMAPGWFWGSSGPMTSDDNRCGASGGGSGNANGPEVSFVSACGR